MIKNRIALLLLVVTIAACKNQTSQAESEAEKARKETEAKVYSAVKAYVLINSLSDTPAEIDTVMAVSMDTATEKMAWLHSCSRIEKEKKAYEDYILSLEKSIAVEKEIHISLAETDMASLKNAQLKQKIINAQLEECHEKAKNADDTKFIYYKVVANSIQTTTKGADTIKGTYFVDKDFKVKTF